ncbi:MAG: DUF3311 domain-containing protein [Planctomycetota bacterium]
MAGQRIPGLWVWGLVLLLIVLHQDNFFWHDDTLVLGFLPIGLFYHACISVAAAVTWFLGTKYAWPNYETEGTAAESQEAEDAR